MAAGDPPIYAVRAEAVPVLITAHQFGPADFRIHLARGIGWSPTKYTSRQQVLAALLAMKSYRAQEAQACKAICRPTPVS